LENTSEIEYGNYKINVYHIVTFAIVFLFGLLSIKYQNMIGAISGYYFIPIILILKRNIERNYFKTLGYCVLLICLNELLIRTLGDIGINSDGNPWACLFFYKTIFISFITLFILTIITNRKKENIANQILYLTLSFLVIAIIYFLITKPI
jgi:hypothetical protein